MLSWWAGRPANGQRVEDGDHEPPETPAPVFAARALKSAIFGTPAHPNDDTIHEIEKDTNTMAAQDSNTLTVRGRSPTKPPSILLTPGTATTRRKTVSFDNEVVDKKETVVTGVALGRSGIPDDCPGKFPSPWPTKSGSSNSLRKTTLTRTLEKARKGRPAKSETFLAGSVSEPSLDLIIRPTSPSKSQNASGGSAESNQDLALQLFGQQVTDGDITMDLNQPHSQSGRYWKTYHEQYHEEARAEMTKLINYKQLAKSYAKIKDAENVNLSEKLKESQQMVADMENKISQLSLHIETCAKDGNEDDSPAMMKELARQTALAVQYKVQVKEFQAVLENTEARSRTSSRDLAGREEALSGSKQAREQSKEISALEVELKALRLSKADVERTNQKLLAENSRLSQELLHADLRLESHLEKCKKKRHSLEEKQQKRGDVLQKLQADYDKLKQIATASRQDAEHLLKKRHDQVVDLKKEIASLHGADSTAQELQRVLEQKTMQREQTLAAHRKEIEDLQKSQTKKSRDFATIKTAREWREESNTASKTTAAADETQSGESQIPILTQPISRPSKALQAPQHVRSETSASPAPRHRASEPALREIVNGTRGQATPFQRTGPVQHTPVVHDGPYSDRFSHMFLSSPEKELHSPEPAISLLPSRAVHERNCIPSPRPSMFNIASSPPKAAVIRPRVSHDLLRQKSTTNMGSRQPTNMATSHLSSMDASRTRRVISPARQAAAKARLQQKQMEKRQALDR